MTSARRRVTASAFQKVEQSVWVQFHDKSARRFNIRSFLLKSFGVE